MKAKLRNFGWAGWAMVGLGVLLVAGAIVAANIQGEGETGEEQTHAVDASEDDVANVSDTPSVGSDEVMEGVADTPGELPQGGAVGQEEFEYYYRW